MHGKYTWSMQSQDEAFEKLKNAINNVREKLGHDEWVYETDYM